MTASFDRVQQCVECWRRLPLCDALACASERDGLAGVTSPVLVGGSDVSDLDRHAAHVGEHIRRIEAIPG